MAATNRSCAPRTLHGWPYGRACRRDERKPDPTLEVCRWRFPECDAPVAGWCCGLVAVHQLRLSTRPSGHSYPRGCRRTATALVGIVATGRGELVFDTSRGSWKYRNLSALAHVALVIGWVNDITVQCDGTADVPTGVDRDRCLQAYFAQYRDGVGTVAFTTSRTFVSVRVGCGTAITGLGLSPWRRPF
jgi:hypothetical protein